MATTGSPTFQRPPPSVSSPRLSTPPETIPGASANASVDGKEHDQASPTEGPPSVSARSLRNS